MAADKDKKEQTENIGGRELVISATGMHWKDDGTVVTPEERAFLLELSRGDLDFSKETKLDFSKETKQNPDLLFYSYEVQKQEGKPFEMNPIRGMVLSVFKRPNNFKSVADDDDKEAPADDRLRVASFWLLTAPCWVKTLGKKVRLAHPNEKVWVDLNQSTIGLLTGAKPRYEGTQLIGIVEAAISPQFKDPFQYTDSKGNKETRQAWRADTFGGWNGGSTFKRFGPAEIKKYAAFLTAPSPFVTDEQIARELNIALPGSIEAPALTP